MIDLRAGRRYARALMGLVLRQGQADPVEKDFTAVRTVVDQHPEITRIVLNSTVPHAEKQSLMDKLFGEKIARPLLDFLKVLIEKRRFSQLGNIQEEFHRLYEKQKGIREIKVISPVALAPESRNKIAAVLKQKLRSEIRLVTEVDPKILGGLIVRFDGREMDMSFRARFFEIRQLLTA